MDDFDTPTKPLKLWRREPDGSVKLKELRPSMFPDADAYTQAVDEAWSRGFIDEFPKENANAV